MITRRRFLSTSAATGAIIGTSPARAGVALWSASLGGHQAVYFNNGVNINAYPSTVVNSVNPTSFFPPAQPAVLDLAQFTKAVFIGFWMNSITPPFTGQTHPIFGLRNSKNDVLAVRMLPPGIYNVLPWIAQNQYQGAYTQVNAINPVGELRVLNPQVGGAVGRYLAFFDNQPYSGQWRNIQWSYNAFGDPAGGPGIVQAGVSGPNMSPNIYHVYEAPFANGIRASSPMLNLPTGNPYGFGNPTAWAGYLPPFGGGDPGITSAQNNSYNGALSQVILDAGSSALGPFPGVNLYDVQNAQTLVRSSGLGNHLQLRQLQLPNGVPAHTPTVLLQGSARPSRAPGFLHGDILFINNQFVDTSFQSAIPYVEIESIDIQQSVESRFIGDPFSGGP